MMRRFAPLFPVVLVDFLVFKDFGEYVLTLLFFLAWGFWTSRDWRRSC